MKKYVVQYLSRLDVVIVTIIYENDSFTSTLYSSYNFSLFLAIFWLVGSPTPIQKLTEWDSIWILNTNENLLNFSWSARSEMYYYALLART